MTNGITVNFLWIGSCLSDMERLSLTSFVAKGHKVQLWTYDTIPNVPKGVNIMDGSTVLSRDSIFQTSLAAGGGGYANFADLFRYTLLSKQGGWWADCDVVCLSPFDLPDQTLVASTNEGQFGYIANNCVLRSPAGGELIERCRQFAESHLSSDSPFGTAGPRLLDRIIRELKCPEVMAPPSTFCPVNWNCCAQLILSRRLIPRLSDIKNRIRRPHLTPNFTKNTIAVHLWSDMWKQNNWNKNGKYPPSSRYERLKHKFGLE